MASALAFGQSSPGCEAAGTSGTFRSCRLPVLPPLPSVSSESGKRLGPLWPSVACSRSSRSDPFRARSSSSASSSSTASFGWASPFVFAGASSSSSLEVSKNGRSSSTMVSDRSAASVSLTSIGAAMPLEGSSRCSRGFLLPSRTTSLPSGAAAAFSEVPESSSRGRFSGAAPCFAAASFCLFLSFCFCFRFAARLWPLACMVRSAPNLIAKPSDQGQQEAPLFLPRALSRSGAHKAAGSARD
mmetsp:Transcript_4339/g.17045  ORF Transcript_4339/g.17045 Transcript_4339/m.17045 type:complete len:243 (-) Transcript_4339:74-802(-)